MFDNARVLEHGGAEDTRSGLRSATQAPRADRPTSSSHAGNFLRARGGVENVNMVARDRAGSFLQNVDAIVGPDEPVIYPITSPMSSTTSSSSP